MLLCAQYILARLTDYHFQNLLRVLNTQGFVGIKKYCDLLFAKKYLQTPDRGITKEYENKIRFSVIKRYNTGAIYKIASRPSDDSDDS